MKKLTVQRPQNDLLVPIATINADQKPVVLAPKLQIPRTHRDLVVRPRLLAKLNAIAQHRLALVCAPAGYGKTTLVAEWAAGRTNPPAWLSLDASDSDLGRFWSYFISALQTVDTNIGVQAQRLFQHAGPRHLESILSILLNELSAVQGDWTLVLDDYHVITAEDVHQSMAFLVEHLPEHVHLVIASRCRPPLPLGRLLALRQLIEIGKSDLALTASETGELFRQARVAGFTGADVDLVLAKTEGWVAGLQLVALAIEAHPNPSEYVARLTGSQRHIADYLTEEVFRQQPLHVQDFLLKTCILDRLCPPLCSALLGDEHRRSRNMLDHLERANLFLVALDDERHWYRYHHLFAEWLRGLLCDTHPDLVSELYHRASLWYEQEGHTALAIQMALQAQDGERAAHLIEINCMALVMGVEQTTALTWIDTLPPELVRSRSRLCIAKASSLVWAPGRFDETERCLFDAERLLRNDTGPLPHSEGIREELGMLAYLRGLVAIIRNEPEYVVEFSSQVITVLPPRNPVLGRASHLNLGFAYNAIGELNGARRSFAETIRLSEQAPSLMMDIYARNGLAEAERMRGNLRASARALREALAIAALPGGQYLPISAASHIQLATLLYEWNELDEAGGHLTLGIDLSTRSWTRRGMIQCFVTEARLKGAQGDKAGALLAIRQAEAIFEERHLIYSMEHTAAAQLRFWMQAGCLEDIRPMIRSLQQTLVPANEIAPAQQEKMLAIARWLVAEGAFQAAEQWLVSLVQSAERRGFQRRLIEALVLQALASWGTGDKRQAHFALSQSLELAEPQGYARVFIDEGAPMRALLERAAHRDVQVAYAARLLEAMGDWETSAPLAKMDTIEPLTERELEILALIAGGLSTQQVAQRLVISVATTRTHLANIFGKLQVHTRLHAIQRARELNLL